MAGDQQSQTTPATASPKWSPPMAKARVVRPPRVVLDLEKLRHINCGLGRFCKYLSAEILAAAGRSIEPVFFMPPTTVQHGTNGGVEHIDVSPWRKESFASLYRPLVQPFLRGQPGERYDLWHITNQMSKYLPLDDRVPVVLTIHDLNFVHDDEHKNRPHAVARKQRQIQRKVDRSVAIVTDSSYVARDVAAHLRVGQRPIHVVPLGLAQPVPASPSRPTFMTQGEFLLSVGNALPHKNIHVLFDLIERMPGKRLVIAGKKSTPYGAILQDTVVKRGLRERVVLTGEVSDGDRQWLYENCEAFLFPSLAEGFGFPVLEAMQCGKPVFMSRSTSLPEIGGELGFYWDSYAADHMMSVFTAGMQRVAGDHNFAAKLRAHTDSFSWARTAQAYLRVYDSVLRSGAA